MFAPTNSPRPATVRPYLHSLTLLVTATLLSVCATAFGQNTYYVASTGNDNNNGRSVSAPFQSLAKVSNLPLQAGDSVLFRRGDTFRGTLTIRQSGSSSRNIVYDAYGSEAKPVLAGSVPVTNWTNIGGNVWQANCSSCGNSVTGLYRNGVSLPLGRYPNADAPNKGYLTIRAHTDNYQIFSVEPLPDNIDFYAAEVVMRPTQWIIDKAVVGHEYHPDVLNITYNSSYNLTDGWGYFLQNHPGTLDQNGEWCYDATTKNIQLYNSQTDPNSQLITATNQSRGIDLAYVSNVIVRNLNVTQTLNEAVATTNVSSFTMLNNDITNSGEDGITIKGYGTNIWLENNKITDVNNNGVYTDAIQNFTFRGNSLRRVGMIPGRGKPGDGQYNGMQSNANQNVLIENNVIDSIGYNGIQFWNNTTIRQNVISNYCMTKSDGGALYAFNSQKAAMTNIHVVSNIIYNGIGAPEGSFRKEYSGANGIFLDDCVTDVELRDNTVFNNHQWGIYLHATSRITARGNTSFDNGATQFVMYHDAGYCPFRENIVKNNISVSKLASQLVAQYESNANDLQQYGVIDSNYYARPFDDGAKILGIINNSQGGVLSLNDWRTFSGGFDLNSKNSPITYNQYKNEGSGGTTRINSTFDSDTDGWYVVYTNYNNVDATFDNSNKLDGGSLRTGVTTPSGQTNSYAQVIKRFGTITKGKTYILRFDAIASTNVNILAYLRTYGPPYEEYDRRYTVALSPTRKSYEFVFTATNDGTDAVVMFQIDAEGPVFWLDNIRFQEDVSIRNNENDFIKLYYNPTLKDTVIALPAGNYRDVKNQLYSTSAILKPFTSVILLKDTASLSLADLSLSLQSNKRVLRVNETASIRLRISNQSNNLAALSKWTYRLPANLQFIDTNGQPYSDNVLTGTVQQLTPLADTTFSILVRPTVAGIFRTAAQITTATYRDPDSIPNSGTADGEDDAATIEFRVSGSGPTDAVFASPNPNQRVLPSVTSSQPTPNPSQADLSLRMDVDHRTPAIGDILTITLYVKNIGGANADAIQLQNQLPAGFQFVNSANWTVSGQTLTATIGPLAAGTAISTSFQVQVMSMGRLINQAQISASNIADPDSTPGNGFTNGEDDTAQIDIRVR